MRKKTLTLIILLSMLILIPNISVHAESVRIASSNLEFHDYSSTMPDGTVSVYWRIKFMWLYEGEEIGYAWQYVIGDIDESGIADVYGYGVYTSTVSGLSGKIYYHIANVWDMNTGEITDFRMHIHGKTGSFKTLQGTAEADFPDFLMDLNFNPWD
jgi:hypothetical protein